jgi:hypothetical protein
LRLNLQRYSSDVGWVETGFAVEPHHLQGWWGLSA